MKKLSVLVIALLVFTMVFSAHSALAQEELAPLNDRITSYLARVMETNSIQLVHSANMHFAEIYLEETEYANLPLVSQVAPQKAGRKDDGGPEFYIDIQDGNITQKDLESIVYFSDPVAFMKMSGSQLLEWIEATTANFNQIDPDKSEDQFLVNDDFTDYNFDQFEGVNYVIDVTKPVGERIIEATINGTPLKEIDEVMIVTNGYRAGGGGDFPNVKEKFKVEVSDKATRQSVVDYLKMTEGDVPAPNHNWYIKPVETEGQVLFRSAPDASDYITENKLIEQVGSFGGWGVYKYNLSKSPK